MEDTQNMAAKKKAVCLLSGGLDSTTALYIALRDGYEVTALTFHYGQLHDREVHAAKNIAAHLGVPHRIVPISIPWGGSALLDPEIPLPKGRDQEALSSEIPSTYVPARNTIFLAFALSLAETLDAAKIFIGATAVDYSGYPDCRPEYFKAFRELISTGTKAGIEGKKIEIEAPLLRLSKRVIVQLAELLKVPFELTWSCYQGGETPCGSCDACLLRAKGFDEARTEDPLMIHAESSLS